MCNQALLASKFGPRPAIPVAPSAAVAASSTEPCLNQTRDIVPQDLVKVLDRLMPEWTVAQGPYPSVTGTVRDINVANQLMADVEAVTGSKLVVARTRTRSSNFLVVHRCKCAVAANAQQEGMQPHSAGMQLPC
jgi:hypothetical protein